MNVIGGGVVAVAVAAKPSSIKLLPAPALTSPCDEHGLEAHTLDRRGIEEYAAAVRCGDKQITHGACRLAVAAAILLVAPRAAAQSPCPEPVETWLRDCAAAERIAVHEAECIDGRVVVSASAGGPELRVELGNAQARAFRKAGPIGLSPIGDFEDWSAQPASHQRVLEALYACALRDSAPLRQDDVTQTAPAPGGPRPWPWRAIGGALAALVLLGAAVLRTRKACWRDLGIVLLLALTGWLSARALFSPGFFHPNGRGPSWIERAVDGASAGWGDYGPGFEELYSRVAACNSHPESTIVLLQSLLGAVMVAAVFVTARAVGASRGLAVAAAAVLAVDSVRARVFESPSYYGTIAALLSLSTAVLASVTWRGRWDWRVPVGVIGAALFASQAARVHPIGWAALGCVPLVAFLGRGTLRARLKLSVGASAGCAAVVAATTLPAMLRITRTGLWSQWIPELARDSWPRVGLPHALAIACFAVVLLTRNRRDLLRVIVAGLTVLAWAATTLVSGDGPAYEHAYFLLFFPVVIASLASLRWQGTGRRLVPVAIIAGAILWSIHLYPTVAKTSLPSSEDWFALSWRESIPAGSQVIWMARAGRMITMLPVYRRHASTRPLQAEAPLTIPRSGYWYRSSLCSTPQAAERCEAIERSLRLEPVATAEFEAIPGHPAHGYSSLKARVGLYRIIEVTR